MQTKNVLKEQVLSINEILETQLDNAFTKDLEDVISLSEIFDVREIYIVGSGDSYAAALAFAPLLEKYCDGFGVNVMDPLHFSRYLAKDEIGIGEPNNPLVIFISASGSPSRIYEGIVKANKIGAFTVLLTGNSESRSASVAKRVYKIDTKKVEGGMVGLETYISSMLGLIAFTSRFGLVRGTLSPSTEEEWREKIIKLNLDYMSSWNAIDETIKQFANENKDYIKYDFIGDNIHQASALFGSFSAVEAFGAISTVDDSENWAHINTFFKDPETIPTIIVTSKNSNSQSRVLETIKQANGIGRPILVIGDVDDIDGVTVCKIPTLSEEDYWLQPLFDCLPLALLSAYITEAQNKNYFRMNDDGSNKFFDIQTIASSEVEIYE